MGFKKLEIPLSQGANCKAYFDILNRLGVIYECDGQTDRQTDRWTDFTVTIASAALHYVVRPKPKMWPAASDLYDYKLL